MKKLKIKLISVSILILTFVLLFSTITYARPLTDIFGNGLIQINNFFVQEQFKAYATAIDFFFFALLFIAIYMMGARYAFKEIKRPEQVIVILLGLMTAFLLVIGGFSATILLPYINWLLYLLLFILLWRLLKGIKNPFWRFILALLLTLLIIGFFAWLFNLITTPEIGGVSAPSLGIGDFFKSFADSFKGINFGGYQPGIPPYIRDALQLPSVPAPTPTPTGPDTLPPTTTPATQPGKKGWLPGGYSGWHLGWIIPLIIAIILGVRKVLPKREPKPKTQPEAAAPPTEELTIQDIIDAIGKKIKNKTDSKTNIEKINQDKNRLLQQGDAKTGYISHLIRIVNEKGEEEIANLFLDESRTLEKFEEGNIEEVIKKEREFVQELKNLKGIEWDLYYNYLVNGSWETVILQKVTEDKKSSVKSLLYMLKLLIDQNINQRAKDSEKGILWLIVFCYNLEKKENILAKELLVLFDKSHIEELVKGKFKEAIKDELTLEAYNQKENELIALLLRRISKQIEVLEYLKKLLSVPIPTTRDSLLSRMRNLIDIVGKERSVLKNISDALDKTKVPPAIKKEADKVVQLAEAAAKGLKEFAEKVTFEKLPKLLKKSKDINKKVKAVVGLIRQRIKNIRAAEVLEQLEEAREEGVRALGQAEEVTSPGLVREELPTIITRPPEVARPIITAPPIAPRPRPVAAPQPEPATTLTDEQIRELKELFNYLREGDLNKAYQQVVILLRRSIIKRDLYDLLTNSLSNITDTSVGKEQKHKSLGLTLDALNKLNEKYQDKIIKNIINEMINIVKQELVSLQSKITSQQARQTTVQTPNELFGILYRLLESGKHDEAGPLLEENRRNLDAKQFKLLQEFVKDAQEMGLNSADGKYKEKRRMEIE